MVLPEDSSPFPSTAVPTVSQPSTDINHSIPPQENGVSPSTTPSVYQPTSEGPATPNLSVSNPLRIPKLSAATAELLARANGSFSPHPIGASDNAMTNGSNTGEASSSVHSNALYSDMSNVVPLASSSVSRGGDTPMANVTPPGAVIDPQPTTPAPINVTSSIKTSENVTPKANSSIDPKAAPLRDIAPHPTGASTPLVATPSSTSKRQRTSTTGSTSAVRRRKTGPRGPNKRRKTGRNNGDDDDEGVIRAGDSSSDESDEATPITTQTKSGRQIHRPTAFVPAQHVAAESPTTADAPQQQQSRKRRRVYRKGREMNVTCKRCERGHSPQSNMIVFCDDCNRAWHQFCHDPPIEDRVISVKESEWFCKECRPAEALSSDDILSPNNIAHTTETTRTTARPPPPNIPPPVITPSETKVGSAQFTLDQRRGYLYTLSHSHLVNMLIEISTTTPDLPIFPSNLLDLPISTMPPPPPKIPTITTTSSTDTTKPPLLTGPSATSVSTLATLNSLSTPQSSDGGRNAPSDDGDNNNNDFSDDEYIYIEEHRLYPRAGNGFRLPPDAEDLDILLEDPGCTTFSHSLHGAAKARAEMAVVA
ncbi:hypothetical protein FQN50_003631 [Emmonsiellopsis sp. PD_5]|nr:hypothetical protein FQN50_003631 [Emmonsiellopsis sp. PD_5]